MKNKVTKKYINERFKNVISIGYCDASELLTTQEPLWFTSGLYGWNADIYYIDSNTVIVTGYRPFRKYKYKI